MSTEEWRGGEREEEQNEGKRTGDEETGERGEDDRFINSSSQEERKLKKDKGGAETDVDDNRSEQGYFVVNPL